MTNEDKKLIELLKDSYKFIENACLDYRMDCDECPLHRAKDDRHIVERCALNDLSIIIDRLRLGKMTLNKSE